MEQLFSRQRDILTACSLSFFMEKQGEVLVSASRERAEEWPNEGRAPLRREVLSRRRT